MSYSDQRARVLVHAKAAALATHPKFTNVAVGAPVPRGAKGVRLCYGGEAEPPLMEGEKTLSGELVGEVVGVVAWWAVSNLSDAAMEAVEDEMFTFKHELRTRLTADQTLNATAQAVQISPFERVFAVVGGTRFEMLGTDVAVGYSEYPY